MSVERRRYGAEFKVAAVGRMAGCGSITALELGVRRKFLYLWRETAAPAYLTRPAPFSSPSTAKAPRRHGSFTASTRP